MHENHAAVVSEHKEAGVVPSPTPSDLIMQSSIMALVGQSEMRLGSMITKDGRHRDISSWAEKNPLL